jgi:hypothetical protein
MAIGDSALAELRHAFILNYGFFVKVEHVMYVACQN